MSQDSRGVAIAAALARAPRGSARPKAGRRGVPLLATVPLFSELSKRHLRRLADLAEVVRYRDGRVVIEAGLSGNAFFVIAEGRAKVFKRKVPGGRPVARLGPGEFFGEMALLDGGPRTATITADGPLIAIRLTRSAFQKTLTREPSIAFAVMRQLATRIRRGDHTE